MFPLRRQPDSTGRILLILLSVIICASVAHAQSSTFTYQGKLTDGGTPANGTYDLQFSLYDALTLGNLQGSPNTVTKTGVNVTNGIFTVQLDFGASAFSGADRFLDIGVKHPMDDSYTLLLPRQQLTSTPYAMRSLNSANANNAMNADKLGSNPASFYVLTSDPRLSDARPPTANSSNYIQNRQSPQAISNFNISGNGVIGGTLTAGALIGDGSGITNLPGGFQWQVVAGTSQQAQPNKGYVATDANEVTITLPTAPNIGDTIRVSGAGVGGWRIAQNSGQQILAPNFSVLNFTPVQNWRSVASSADGSKLVAAVDGGQIYTSTDSGANWTPRDSNRSWPSVASSSDGSKLAAAAFSGQIYTSTDSGVNWTPRDSDRSWVSVASSADGSKLVALVYGGQIYTSTDSGANWTPRDSNRSWDSVASSSDGSKLVALVDGGQIYTSTDSGASWTPRDSNRGWVSVASSADGSRLVAAPRGGQIYTSTDSGANWTPRDSDRLWSSVASSGDGSKLVAVVDGGQIYTSTDSGSIWTSRDSDRSWASVASSSDGSKLVALVSGGEIYTSTDSGMSWTARIPSTLLGTGGYLSGGQSTAIELQYIGGGLFLPLSHEGSLTAH